jgi:hypothetical protein
MAEKHVVPLDPADGLGTAALPFGHVATRQMQVSQEASAPAAQAGCVVVYADENGDLWRRLPNGDIEAVGGGEVESVNGQTGVVVLAAADVGAEESGAVASHVGETDPHTQYEETAAKGQPGGYAELDATGKVPSTQIPAVAITDFLGEVATEAAMLALDGEKGDWCIRTDLGAALILIEDGGDDLSNWKQMPSPTAPVLSVNGQTGAVSLDSEDVGADPTGSAAAAEAAAIAACDPAGSAATVQSDLDAQRTAQKEPSGFESPEAVSVAYSYANRTFSFTQSGGIVVWVDGERFVKTSPWVSPAHTDAPGRYWLTVDDSGDFAWATSVWAFSAVQAGYVAYQNASLNGKTVPMRECHGLMQWQGHQELHERIGTYIRSGGALVPGSFALQPASPTDADNAPDIAEAVLADEDLPTTLPQLLASASAYAHAWSAAGGTVAMDMSFSPYIFKNPITNYPPYYPASGTPTEISNNRYVNYYLLEIPVTTDATGQQWRFVWLQPWTEYSSLVGAQAEEIAAFPAYAALQASIPEFVPYVRVTMRTSNTYGSTGKCRFEAVTYLIGGRAAPIYISSGGGDVVGPVGAVDNALCRFDGTTGKLLQDSLVSVSDAGVVSLPVGAVGAPALVFDANTTTGIFAPASDTVAISTSGAERARVFADGGVQIGGTISTSPGAGVTRIASTGGTVASFTNTACTLTQRAATTGSPSALKVSGGAHTGLTAGTEVPGVEFDLAQVKTHAAGAITTQREIICRGSTHAFNSASTITTAATLAIASIPVAGANCTITERLALWVQAGLTKLAGGLAFVSGAFKSTINTLTLTADRTISTPDADGTVTLNEAANTFTGANTFRNALPIKVENAANQDAILLTGRAGGTSGYTLTVVPGALSSSRTITLPNLTGTLVTSNNTHTISGPWTFQNSAGVRAQQAANQDAVVINGRAGGSGGYEVSVVPAALSADRTATLPDKDGTVAMLSDISGGATAEEVAAIRDQLMYLMFRDDAGYSNIAGLMFDSFTDQLGVDDAASTGEIYDSENDLYENDLSVGSNTLTGGTASASSSYTTYTPDKAVDGNAVAYWLSNVTPTGSWQYDLGSGVSKTFRRVTLRAVDVDAGYSPKDFKIQGSNNGSSWTDLSTQTGVSWTTGEVKTFTFANSTAYRYLRVDITAVQTGGYNPGIAEATAHEITASDMVLVSEDSTASAEPTTARISLFVNPVDSPTLNTDLKAYASRDGGSTWDQITMAKASDLASSIDQLSGEVTLTSTGTTMKLKVTTHNNKSAEITGWGLSWR